MFSSDDDKTVETIWEKLKSNSKEISISCVCVCVCVVCYIHKEVFDTIIPEQVDILEYLNYLFFNSVTQSLSLSNFQTQEGKILCWWSF